MYSNLTLFWPIKQCERIAFDIIKQCERIAFDIIKQCERIAFVNLIKSKHVASCLSMTVVFCTIAAYVLNFQLRYMKFL